MDAGPRSIRQGTKERWMYGAVFVLCCSWLLPLPSEGSILFLIADLHPPYYQSTFIYLLLANLAGVLMAGLVSRSAKISLAIITSTVAVNILLTISMIIAPTKMLPGVLIASSLFTGFRLVAWGYFYKSFVYRARLIKANAMLLFFSSFLIGLLELSRIYLGPATTVAALVMCQIAGLLIVLKLSTLRGLPSAPSARVGTQRFYSPLHTAFLAIFVFVISLTISLIHQGAAPTMLRSPGISSWYWMIPYLGTILIFRKTPRSSFQSFSIPIGSALLGFTFVAFSFLKFTPNGFIVVETLMLSSRALLDLFVWSLLGEILITSKSPSGKFGIIFSASTLGLLVSTFLVSNVLIFVGSGQGIAFSGLAVIGLTLLLFPGFTRVVTNFENTQKQLTGLIKKLTVGPFEGSTPSQEFSGNQSISYQMGVEQGLTKREREVASLLISGMTYREISTHLFVTENTVKSHVKSIYLKSGVQSRSQLMNLYFNEENLINHP